MAVLSYRPFATGYRLIDGNKLNQLFGGGMAVKASVQNGTAAAPSINFANSPTTGFYRSAADAIAVTIGGAQQATWDASAGLTVSSIITPSGGFTNTGRLKYSTIPIGSVAYGSLGTNTTPVAGTIYWAEVFVPRNITMTGVGFLNGATVGTDSVIVAVYGSAGALLANSALAGVVTSGSNAFQEVAFTATKYLTGPARYWIAVQVNGTTTRLRTIAASTFVDTLTKSVTGTFGTLTTLTPPSTFTADVGIIAYLYQ